MKGSTCKAPTIYFSGPRDLENAVNWPIISILSATELSLETNHRTSIGDRILTRLPFPAIGLAVLGDRNLNAYIYYHIDYNRLQIKSIYALTQFTDTCLYNTLLQV